MSILQSNIPGRVGLTVTSLKWAGGEQEGQDNDRRIPDALEYQDVVDREDDIGTGILDEELVTGDKAHGKLPTLALF